MHHVHTMRHYDFAEVLAHCDLTRNRLASWCDAEIIQAVGGRSSGKRREFSFRNLIEARVCDELRGLGVTEASMPIVVQSLNVIWDQPDAPINERPDSPTFRDAILWMAFQRLINPINDSEMESVNIYPVDFDDLKSRLTDGLADGSGVAESGIRFPSRASLPTSNVARATSSIFASMRAGRWRKRWRRRFRTNE
jgi:hypothetical protein